MPFFDPILNEIIEYFGNSPEAQRRVLLLVKKDRQAEAWFKTELMNIFEQSQFVQGYRPEATYVGEHAGLKCDFDIERRIANSQTIRIGVEVKTAFVGYQNKRPLSDIRPGKPSRFNLSSYVGQPRDKPSGVAGDAYRLVNFTNEYFKERICLVFAYGCPDAFRKFGRQRIDPEDVPERFTKALKDKIEPVEAKLLKGSTHIDFQKCRLWILAYEVWLS